MNRLFRALTPTLALVAGLWACAGRPPTVVVYVSGDPDLAEWVEEAFAASHPEERIQVEALAGPSALERIRSEGSTPVADVWLGAPSWLLATAASQDLLTPAPPVWAGGIPDDMRDAQGRWTGWVADPLVVAFNPDRTSRGQAPRDWVDVFHPRWVGEVLLPDPRGSEAMQVFIGTEVLRARSDDDDETPGFDWLARLDAARKEYVGDPGQLVRRLGRGEVSLGLLPLSLAQAAKDRGEAVDYRVPESGSPTLVLGAAALEGGPHPAGAGTLLEWLGDTQVQAGLARHFGYLPVVDSGDEAPDWVREVRPMIRLDVAPADTLAARLDGWVERWRREVMGRTTLLF